ncbi:MAG: hypothetical protein EAZ89_10850 [Bacteroidetes bacterium]|nr:MAG: hypothetical protein EAZ89_10850 [Bacteroidota bacterium]
MSAKRSLILPFLLLFSLYLPGQQPLLFERLIGESIYAYPLRPDQQLRLAAYAELRGQYDSQHECLTLPFAGLGSLSFYKGNCLLKTADRQVFHMNRGVKMSNDVSAFILALDDILDKVLLLGNPSVPSAHLRFVDEHLARKNIEPYDKLYLRHMLLRFGRYDSVQRVVEFYSDWLPGHYLASSGADATPVVTTPMKIRLDEKVLRGYFIWAGGTVYVEDVAYKTPYASSEVYSYNVSAFKLFAQKLFVQSVQYLVAEEGDRLKPEGISLAQQADTLGASFDFAAAPAVSAAPAPAEIQQPVLYSQYHWIPMMLGLLRARDINIGDSDVICYFTKEPFFDELYAQMTVKERAKADAYLRRE